MDFSSMFVVLFSILCALNVANIVESALPFGIFPILTSGWYYKPSPVESVIFGLMVVKVLAIRLAAITGVLPIPYHLNDLFVRSLGKRSLPEYFSQEEVANLKMPHTPIRNWNNSAAKNLHDYKDESINTTDINPNELKTMYRLLLGVRRLDISDCFLKTLCFIGYDATRSKNISLRDRQLIETINYLTSMEETTRKTKSSVMDVFQKAIAFGMESAHSPSSCDREYLMCNLTEDDMKFESIIADLP